MKIANIKKAGLCAFFLISAMGSSSEVDWENPDYLEWGNLLGIGSCMEESPIVIQGQQEPEELKLVNFNPRYEVEPGVLMSVTFLVTGGRAPYYSGYGFGDGTGESNMVNLALSYAAASHRYERAGTYYGFVIVQDSEDRTVQAEFVVVVKAK